MCTHTHTAPTRTYTAPTLHLHAAVCLGLAVVPGSECLVREVWQALVQHVETHILNSVHIQSHLEWEPKRMPNLEPESESGHLLSHEPPHIKDDPARHSEVKGFAWA